MKELHIECDNIDFEGTVVYVVIDKKYVGNIVISDEIKEDTKQGIENLKKQCNIKDIIMLTGDRKNIAEKIGKDVNIDKVYSELLPNEKVEKIEEIIKNKNNNKKVIFVGDGVNDAPVLARADIGIAMGALGSDAAIESADIVIMTDEISKIAKAIRISKKTLRIAHQNINFAIFVKILVLVLSAFGISNMWQAVFADVGVTVIAVLNSLRALNIKNII